MNLINCDNLRCENDFFINNDLCVLHNIKYTHQIAFGGSYNENFVSTYSKRCVSKIIFKYSELNYMPMKLFKKCPQIIYFDISNSSINTVHKSAFEGIVNLEHLDLSFNKITEIQENTFAYGQNITFLDLSNNQLDSIHVNLFRAVTNLEKLNLSFNKIKKIPEKIFNYGSSLSYLNLSNNKIKEIPDNTFTYGAISLTILDLSFNQIESFHVGIFKHLFNLIQLHLNDNHIKTVCLQYFNSVENLYLENNQITEFLIVESDDVDYFDFINLSNNSLTEFNAVNSNIKKIIIENSELKKVTLNENVVEFKGKNNKIKYFNFTNLTNLEILDLSNNPIGKSIKMETFAQLENLTELYLKNTEMKNIQKETFSHQINLNILDISYNKLGRIDLQNFNQMTVLEKLFIHGNDLITIDYKQIKANFPNLKLIGLSNNKWNCVHLILLIKKMNGLNIKIHFDSNTYVSSSPLQDGLSCDGEIKPSNFSSHNEDENSLLIEKLLAKLEGLKLKKEEKNQFKGLLSEIDQHLDKRLNIEPTTMKIDTKENEIEIINQKINRVSQQIADLDIRKAVSTLNESESATSFRFYFQFILLLLLVTVAITLLILNIRKSRFLTKNTLKRNLPAILYRRKTSNSIDVPIESKLEV